MRGDAPRLAGRGSRAVRRRPANVDWPVYRGDPKGNQYAPLAQIHAANVHRLERAWEYKTGDANQRSTMHVNPIVVNGVMYVTTPSLKAVALDAATGTRDLVVRSGASTTTATSSGCATAASTYWKGAEGERIFHFVRDRVYAMDAKTGALITSFGTGGYIDLRQNLGVDPATAVIEMTSPGAVFKNFLIIGSRVNESYDASPGHIRAYDTVTGQLQVDLPHHPARGRVGHDTWKWVEGENYGGANAWGGITIDEQRGWVFAATGSATEDFYGGFRKGDNLFANSVLALDATTGERKWHYQTVRHDIWDYDNPPAPILVTHQDRRPPPGMPSCSSRRWASRSCSIATPAQPLFPVQEVPVPRSTVPGEETSPTQPMPLKPPPLVRQSLTEADLTNITPEAHAYALKEFRQISVRARSTRRRACRARSRRPGHLGGAEWHGASFDPRAEHALRQRQRGADDQPAAARARRARRGRQTPVAAGAPDLRPDLRRLPRRERQGAPPQMPALVDVQADARRRSRPSIAQGRNSMPAFRQFRAARAERAGRVS